MAFIWSFNMKFVFMISLALEMFIHYSYKKVHSSNLYHTTLQCDNVLAEALTVLSLSEHCSVYWELDNTNSLSLQCSSAADV